MMTREEAIEVLENGGWWDSLIPVTTIEGRIEDDKLHEALDLALTALRPVSREQVEKVWRGEWIHKRSPYDYKIFVCKKCGKQISIQGENMDFCPACGAAQTDEAVDMMLERWKEALENG